MKKLTTEALATEDAKRWAAAEMFYGEGAGTRRKLLNAELEPKLIDGDYENAFYNAYNALDMNKYAEMAIKERKNIDRATKAGKNIRALKSGNLRGLSTGVYVVVGVAFVAHKTGYDKVIIAESKKAYQKSKAKARMEYKMFKAKREGRNVEKLGDVHIYNG